MKQILRWKSLSSIILLAAVAGIVMLSGKVLERMMGRVDAIYEESIFPRNGIQSAAVSRDGSRIVMVNSIQSPKHGAGRIVCVEAATGRRLWTRSIDSAFLLDDVLITDAGDRVALQYFVGRKRAMTRRLEMRDMRDGRALWSVPRPGGFGWMRISHMGDRFLFWNQRLCLFDARDGRCLDTLSSTFERGPLLVDFASDGELLVIEESGTALTIRGERSGPIRAYEFRDSVVNISLSRDAHVVAVQTPRWIRVFRRESHDAAEWRLPADSLTCFISLSPSGRYLAMGHYRTGVVQVWDVPRRTRILSSPETKYIPDFVFSHDEQRIAISSERGIMVSALPEGDVVAHLSRYHTPFFDASEYLLTISFSPDHRTLYTHAGTLTAWNVP